MGKSRLEAFSDGVIAIIITIMVLKLEAPRESSLESLRQLVPGFLTYALSFVHIGIFWNNHHHLLQAAQRVSGAILWCNLHLLFWIALLPFAAAWMGQNHYAPTPTALYGAVLLMAAIAYVMLQHMIIVSQGPNSILKKAVGDDWKGRLTLLGYFAAILLARRFPWASQMLYLGGALMWLIPDRRVEHVLPGREGGGMDAR